MLPPNDPKDGASGPDADELETVAAGWDPYVTALLTRTIEPRASGDDADEAVPVMSLARVEDRRRR